MRNVPFFRADLTGAEIREVVHTLRSGWLTTGPKTKKFEQEFASFVGVRHAVAVNSCTAALHLALEAVGVARGDRVLVPVLTFAATAEVVRYFDAVPVFVDCEPRSLNMDMRHAAEQAGRFGGKAIMPMHYGGQMCDMFAARAVARKHGLRVVEDAAHALPAAVREGPRRAWRGPGQLSDVACFSFYANKCITTGEGGMAVSGDGALADRMRLMSLHGMSRDPWRRFTAQGSWYYEIVAPGFKYNLTDVAAAIGLHQLRRARELWEKRRRVAALYGDLLTGVDEIECPAEEPGRKHAWHLFVVKLVLDKLAIDRAAFIEELKARGIVCSVHWLPLHMQPYYVEKYGHKPGDFPVAASMWPRLVSLPIFPAMKEAEVRWVAKAIKDVIASHLKSRPARRGRR